jgi:hypothetical protein
MSLASHRRVDVRRDRRWEKTGRCLPHGELLTGNDTVGQASSLSRTPQKRGKHPHSCWATPTHQKVCLTVGCRDRLEACPTFTSSLARDGSTAGSRLSRYSDPWLAGSIAGLIRFALVVAITGSLVAPLQYGLAQETPAGQNVSTSSTDKAACVRQLNVIFGALQEYRKRHDKKLPDRLSDLVPEFIHDPKVLVCPYVQKRGGLRVWKKRQRELAPDPHTSYGYEFPPVLLDYDQWRGLPKKTYREVKERVIKELGPVVPVVRCHDHRPVLNLAIGGRIYESELYWEKNFTTDADLLIAARLFTNPPPTRPFVAADFPPRDPRAEARLIDLSDFYNASLTNSWQGFSSNHLRSLPMGLQEFAGIRFDVRGVIQLYGEDIPAVFPERVDGIRVNQKCSRLHFLHGAGFRHPKSNARVGSYIIHYANGQIQEFVLIAGKQTLDWWSDPVTPAQPTDAQVAWIGANEAAKAYGRSIRLYRATWENPQKDIDVATISFSCNTNYAKAPFLIAITAE